MYPKGQEVDGDIPVTRVIPVIYVDAKV